MVYFDREDVPYLDGQISDFSNPLFQDAFRQYFSEEGMKIRDWDGLFKEMNDDGGNIAFLRRLGNGEAIGFIQFKPIMFTSSFFEETVGFIREFWVAENFRGKKHGTALLSQAEGYFRENGIYTSILTADGAKRFYEKQGYIQAFGCKARNQCSVFVKHLRKEPNIERQKKKQK